MWEERLSAPGGNEWSVEMNGFITRPHNRWSNYRYIVNYCKQSPTPSVKREIRKQVQLDGMFLKSSWWIGVLGMSVFLWLKYMIHLELHRQNLDLKVKFGTDSVLLQQKDQDFCSWYRVPISCHGDRSIPMQILMLQALYNICNNVI